MKTTTNTKTAKPVYVQDKHLAVLPKPTRYELGPIVWTPDEVNAWGRIEDYLNTKADQGWQMVHADPIRWGFIPCEPGEYIYRVVTLEEPYYYPSSQEYLKFLVDSGVDIVFVGKYGSYAIVRRRGLDGPFEITGTVSSKLAHLRVLNNRMISLLWTGFFLLAVYVGLGALILTALDPFNVVLASIVGLGFLFCISMVVGASVLLHRNDKRFLALIAESAIHE